MGKSLAKMFILIPPMDSFILKGNLSSNKYWTLVGEGGYGI
jgi:hypothetical protein